MEKAILKTLAYADLFDYPLKIQEIHKWLIGPPSSALGGLRRVNRKVTLRQIEKALKRLNHESRIKNKGKYYFLPNRDGLVRRRYRRERQSMEYFKKARLLTTILKVIPWIKLVGISGGLALSNASKKDDIDLFVIISKNRLWISRLLILGLLSLTGQRRKRAGGKIAGKLCVNTLLEEDKLEQTHKDIFVAHEVLQMRPLWYRGRIYSKYLEDNEWVFKFLPNWITNVSSPRRRGSNSESKVVNWIPAFAGMTTENLARWLQLKIMSKPQGMERVEGGALYFHPTDYRPEILSRYQKKVAKIISP